MESVASTSLDLPGALTGQVYPADRLQTPAPRDLLRVLRMASDGDRNRYDGELERIERDRARAKAAFDAVVSARAALELTTDAVDEDRITAAQDVLAGLHSTLVKRLDDLFQAADRDMRLHADAEERARLGRWRGELRFQLQFQLANRVTGDRLAEQSAIDEVDGARAGLAQARQTGNGE